MKKNILWGLFFLTLFISQANACDICGCGTGGSFMGIIPHFGSNQIGIRYAHRGFNHPNTILNFNGNSRVIRDEMLTTEISYRHFSKRKWSVFINIPYRINTRFETERTTTIKGIGDLNGNFNYTLVNTSDSMSHRFKHILLVGVGIKVANGKYMQRDETKVMLPTLFQIGTGANSGTGHLYYTGRFKRWGINVNGLYSLNGTNELEYQIGNQMQISSAIFWKKDISYVRQKQRSNTLPFDAVNDRLISLIPSIGYSFESSQQDRLYDENRMYTGGHHHLATAALDVFIQRMAVSAFVQIPIYSNIGAAQPTNQSRFGLALNWRI